MSCSSALYAGNTSAQSVAAGVATTINFGQPIRRFGRSCNMSGGNAVIQDCGYYEVNTNFTLTTATAGEVTIQLYKDGVAVPSGFASFTGETTTAYAVSIPCIVRSTCCCEETITAVITAVGATVISNAAIEVSKI